MHFPQARRNMSFVDTGGVITRGFPMPVETTMFHQPILSPTSTQVGKKNIH